jgi:L-fuconolactonase
MRRRDALKCMLAAAIGCATDAAAGPEPAIPVIDAHIHLFDTSRPGGVPWPEKTDTAIYRSSLPDRYARIARPFGVVGAIAIEASPLVRDNDWVLQQAANHPIIVGYVGDLIPGSASFAADWHRLRGNPLFLGIRYGNLWQRDLGVDLNKPGFVDGLRRIAGDGGVLDTANPDANLIRAVLDVSDRIPELRIVIDHLPNAVLPEDQGGRAEFRTNLKRLSENPRVFIKLSEIPVKVGDRVPSNVSFYRERLDTLWDIFGEDHILFGSDWPNSDHITCYEETFRVVRAYVAGKGRLAEEKFFWKNSVAAYHWHRREPDQPKGWQ